MITKRKFATTAAATFGAALTTLYAAPELQADVVDLTFTPGSIGTDFTTPQAVGVGTTGGGSVGTFFQWNDSIGKTLIGSGIGSVGIVQYSQTLNVSTFFGASAIPFTASSAGTQYVGFRTFAGNVGWFSVDLGGFLGNITYIDGEYGSAGESVHVGGTVPEPTSGVALAALALGAIGVRRNRKKK